MTSSSIPYGRTISWFTSICANEQSYGPLLNKAALMTFKRLYSDNRAKSCRQTQNLIKTCLTRSMERKIKVIWNRMRICLSLTDGNLTMSFLLSKQGVTVNSKTLEKLSLRTQMPSQAQGTTQVSISTRMSSSSNARIARLNPHKLSKLSSWIIRD